MKLQILPALLVSASLVSFTAEAAPLNVSAGESVVFNFDLSGQLGSHATFDHIFFNTGSTWSWEAFSGIAGQWEIYSGLDATGDLLVTDNFNLGSRGSDYPGWLDGVFSAKLSIQSGSISTNPYAKGGFLTNGVWTYTANVYPTIASVPEPETYAMMLAGLGLVVGASRFRASRSAARSTAR